ncbi:PDZ domain-containing protein [Sphingomonas sp. HMP6]|uniref:PDZ domain-containing protein n=1 Tax=Sphingomonas sp. HMP6 TaxID=1517551 RepID=UPI001596D9A5|nr:PDZ domain-containing protein [Sphingomonas sp. HMP6]BCA58542.1 hypothetical protein HMP06_1311 [Sphingomonas sp. HMP6]
MGIASWFGRQVPAILWALSVGLALIPPAQAGEHLPKIRRDAVPVIYQPSLLPNMEAVGKAFGENTDAYVSWCAEIVGDPASVSCLNSPLVDGKVKAVNLSKTRVAFSGAIPTLVDMSVNIADIGSVEIVQFPKLREPFRFAIKVGPAAQAADQKTFWFRARDADVARKLADAFATLSAVGRGSITLDMPQPAFGISARALTAEEMRQAGVESGLYVGAVDAGTPGERLGILRDDYLLEIDGTKVIDLATAQRQLGTAPVQSAKIWRGGKIVILRAFTKM